MENHPANHCQSCLFSFSRSLHVALRRPETMKRKGAVRLGPCGKMELDERGSEVVRDLSFNSTRSLSRVAQTCPKRSLRQAPEERRRRMPQSCRLPPVRPESDGQRIRKVMEVIHQRV